jgi:beta-lactamase superfamily II metal-dependent hydrolase
MSYISARIKRLSFVIVIFSTAICLQYSTNSIGSTNQKKQLNPTNSLPPWSKGFFDIHHISTARGDATYLIFPDGTEMLFDVGDIGKSSLAKYPSLKMAEVRPNPTKQAGAWVADYIIQMRPKKQSLHLDYVAISHFHTDHFGNPNTSKKLSKSGKITLSGLTELAEIIPIKTLIDRAYPDYDLPVDLKALHGFKLENYLNFIEEKKETDNLIVQRFEVGSNSQIRMLHDPSTYLEFKVRNIKSNNIIWDGTNSAIKLFNIGDDILLKPGSAENALGLVLKFSYGNFDYFTGGDITGLQGFGLPDWFDVETPVAKVVGKVDAMTLNHHGNRDASNKAFIEQLAPRVIVQQSWISDQPGGEVVHRITSNKIYPGPRDIFATTVFEETKAAIGPKLAKSYKSFQGHIVIRVEPGGREFRVFILNDLSTLRELKASYGPYISE